MIGHIKFSKHLEWLKPYVLRFAAHEPQITRLISITHTVPRKFAQMQQYACTHWFEDSIKITIMLGSWTYNWKNKRVSNPIFRPFSKVEILEFLSHELSHVKQDFDGMETSHDALRKMIECTLCLEFMEMLELDEYDSEENDIRRLKRVYKYK